MSVTEPLVIIRPAESGDLDALVSLLAILFAIEEDFQIDEKKQRRGLALMLDNRQGLILVAEKDGRVIGMCSGQLLISTAEGGPVLLTEDVIVADGFRSCGIGGKLLAALGEWAAGQGASRLQLLADRTNSPALAFYTRLGWQTTNLICLRRYQKLQDPCLVRN